MTFPALWALQQGLAICRSQSCPAMTTSSATQSSRPGCERSVDSSSMNCRLRTAGHCLVRPSRLLSRAGRARACRQQRCLATYSADKEHNAAPVISTRITGRQELAAARLHFSSLPDLLPHALPPVPADDFIQVWNQRRLPARYYTGLAAGAAIMRRTGFQWGVRTGGARQTCWCAMTGAA